MHAHSHFRLFQYYHFKLTGCKTRHNCFNVFHYLTIMNILPFVLAVLHFWCNCKIQEKKPFPNSYKLWKLLNWETNTTHWICKISTPWQVDCKMYNLTLSHISSKFAAWFMDRLTNCIKATQAKSHLKVEEHFMYLSVPIALEKLFRIQQSW